MNIHQIKEYLDLHIGHSNGEDLLDIRPWFETLEITDWESMTAYNEDQYCRNSLISTEAYDLLILCWKPEQGSSFHGHPSKGCLVKVLDGHLEDELRKVGQEPIFGTYHTGETFYISDDMGEHRVFNNHVANAVSLHLYAPGGYQPIK